MPPCDSQRKLAVIVRGNDLLHACGFRVSTCSSLYRLWLQYQDLTYTAIALAFTHAIQAHMKEAEQHPEKSPLSGGRQVLCGDAWRMQAAKGESGEGAADEAADTLHLSAR